MSIFSYLLPKRQNTASVAKERLQIIVARERSTRAGARLPATSCRKSYCR